MQKAFSYGFDCGMNDANNGYSNMNLKDVFDDWMSEQVADNGSTVEQLLSFNYKET